METLEFQTSPVVNILGNTFINTPIILKYEDVNLIEIVNEHSVSYEVQIPIYHSDGTYLTKVTGNRVYETDAGRKAGVKLEKWEGVTVCKMNDKTIFELHHGTGDSFKASVELYAPEGYFLKITEGALPVMRNNNNEAINILGAQMSGNTFNNCKIGILLKKNGSMRLGV
ncbi:hypothetical protein CLV51_10620 [Chitinophaga niastensis]|uniref:Uncharacterized protein n=1 Tax=Chitinophaga niastensis TaxID=536980 RepID=A0A2P8HD33_CHINA|nr:hypothetical protein [Chitinophaga niastensis]PSL44155.1 hypothetical protein CLV51_10620 [Chitinophaga niastensis]